VVIETIQNRVKENLIGMMEDLFKEYLEMEDRMAREL
jgi:hypothetical protein